MELHEIKYMDQSEATAGYLKARLGDRAYDPTYDIEGGWLIELRRSSMNVYVIGDEVRVTYPVWKPSGERLKWNTITFPANEEAVDAIVDTVEQILTDPTYGYRESFERKLDLILGL